MISAGACSKGGRGQISVALQKIPFSLSLPPLPHQKRKKKISYHYFFLHYFMYVFVEISFTKIENILYRCF